MVRSLVLVLPFLLIPGAAVAATPVAADSLAAGRQLIVVHPIQHASFLLEWDGQIVAVDPVGKADDYLRSGRPHLILVTHRHGDHFDPDLVRELAADDNVVVTPPDVAEMIPACDPVALEPGQGHQVGGLHVLAVPAYNRTESRLAFHPPGRDVGYVLEQDGVRVYISGDTEDIPELATLGRIDAAFLAMNLPWTMSVDQAVAATRMIRPRVLYPYHHRHRDGSHADLDRLIRELPEGIEVRQLLWY